MPLYALGDMVPRVHETAFVAPTAILVGDVEVHANASVWFGAVLRGDSGTIVIGEGSNIQDNAVLHEAVTVGRNCTIAHLALIHGAVLEDDVLIGNGALVYEGSHVGAGAVIGAGAILSPGTRVPPGALMLGAPARQIRPANTDLQALVEARTADYQVLRARYLAALRAIEDPTTRL